jgi:hypothetical protein
MLAGDYASNVVFTAPATDLVYRNGDRVVRLFSFVVPAAYDNWGWSRISLMVGVRAAAGCSCKVSCLQVEVAAGWQGCSHAAGYWM